MLTAKRVTVVEESIRRQEKRDISDSLFRFAAKRDFSRTLPSKPYSYLGSAVRVFKGNKPAVFFLCLMLGLVVFAFAQPLLPGQKEASVIYADQAGMPLRSLPPGGGFIFGTNSIGQDLWSLTWSAVRTSLFIGFAVALGEVAAGVALGLIWGYVKFLEPVITELYNIWNNIPNTLLLILVSYVLKPGLGTLIVTLVMTGFPHTARFVRNQVIIIRDREYNLASVTLGSPVRRILARNILPCLVSVITLRAALAIPSAISHEVFISYIGLGLPAKTPTLGNLIVSSIDKILEPSLRYQLLIPAGILVCVSLSFYVAGSALADAADPKSHYN